MSDAIPSRLLKDTSTWFAKQSDVEGVLLVGSYARGNPRPDSDIDLVILTQDQEKYLGNLEWTRQFGEYTEFCIEDWGALRSVRISYHSGPEVEFGIAEPTWASISPIDPGTFRVVQDAAKVLYDRGGKLADLLAAVSANRSG